MKMKGVTTPAGLLLVACVFAAAPTRAADADEPDDPKISRRLGTRSPWVTASGTNMPAVPAAVPARAASPAAAPGALTAFTDPLAPSNAREVPRPAPANDDLPVIRTLGAPEPKAASTPPRLKLSFRRFEFVQIGASGSPSGAVASEPFNSVSIDVYPVSNFVRVGLSTQYGWQSGTFLANGDYFAAESLSVGAQLPGGRVVPFAEAFAGIGYMRRLQFDRTIPTAYWQLGVDAGAEIYLARTGFVSLALGYLRPVNGFVQLQEFQTVYVDTWSFKLGLGI
jgi:hypothetical protein